MNAIKKCKRCKLYFDQSMIDKKLGYCPKCRHLSVMDVMNHA
jgi:predicted Zn-ribbon and HTH transcriptional regulator